MANEAYFPGIPETDKVKNSQYVIINNEKTGKPDKIRLDKFITNLNLTTDTTPTNNITSVTYSEAQTLITNSGLIAGEHYLISDKADAGIILLAVSTNQFSLEGQGIFLNPDFQGVGTLGADVVGVWHSGLVGLVANTSIAFWNGLHYLNLTGAIGTQPDGDAVNWGTALTKSVLNGYIEEVDFILYDFANDVILERNDKRNNKIASFDTIATFQWGNNNVVNNTAVSGGYYLILNQIGIVASNFVESAGSLYLNQEHEGSIISCTFKGNQVDGNLDAGESCIECSFDLINNITLDPKVSSIGKKISKNESTFEATIDAFAAGVITIPTELNYVGIFTLDNATSSTITKIVNLPTTHKVRFYAKAGETQLFSHAVIAGATANQLVSDAAAINTITGRTNGSDFIEYERAGNLNRRYNAVIAA